MATRARGARSFAPPPPAEPVVWQRPIAGASTLVGLGCGSCGRPTLAILGRPGEQHAECASCGFRAPCRGGERR